MRIARLADEVDMYVSVWLLVSTKLIDLLISINDLLRSKYRNGWFRLLHGKRRMALARRTCREHKAN